MSLSKIKRSDLEFGDELGRGGFSTVYKAKWRKSLFKSEDVAVKKLVKPQETEMQIMSKLDHENIVKLLAVVDKHPEFYLILELCNGGSLRAYLDNLKQNRRHLPDDQFYDWAKQAARPIEYLKTMGVIHKDVKSDNYVIAGNNTLKLTDFGLAKEIDATIQNATGSATCTHMAPELLTEFILSPSYDIFSYGGVLWELWTTEKPFEGLERYAIIWKVCEKNEHPPIPADCPRAIADLMRQCWLVKWKDRPSISHVLSVITDEAAAAPMTPKQRQLLDGPWVLERKIGSEDGPGRLERTIGIAVNSNGDIAAASYKDESVKVYSAQGDHKFNLQVLRHSSQNNRPHPWNVAESPYGNYYYVTDESPYLKCYTNEAMCMGEWLAVSPPGVSSPRCTPDPHGVLRGLVIDAKDQLLVGECKQKYISKLKLGGSPITSIKVGIRPFSLAVTSQDTIIVSDWYSNPSVHIIDNEGRILHIIKPTTERVPSWIPYGIACVDDIICICNVGSGRIHCFSLSGEHVGLLPIEIEQEPRCLTFTPDGKRLIVSYKKSQLCMYRLEV